MIALLDENNIVLEIVDELPKGYVGYFGNVEDYASCVVGEKLGPIISKSERLQAEVTELQQAFDALMEGLV